MTQLAQNIVRMAQYGTKHGHASGKLAAMLHDPSVEFMGVYEPDRIRRDQLMQGQSLYQQVQWFNHVDDMLSDPSIVAVASEGSNAESLRHTEAIVRAGKHVWYDKPAGEDWEHWQRVITLAQKNGLHIQMGYMFRYHRGFQTIADWVKTGLLGNVFRVRAQMSTCLSEDACRTMAVHQGGVYYDLAGHMLDQIVWLLGRPDRVTSFLRNDADMLSGFVDNALVVMEYERAIAYVDIAAMEPRPPARRFEVYGDRGSAILLEPFEPAHSIRLCLDSARDGYSQGVQIIPIEAQSRQSLYELELAAFCSVIRGQQAPDRPMAHERLVQETLLRGTGVLATMVAV